MVGSGVTGGRLAPRTSLVSTTWGTKPAQLRGVLRRLALRDVGRLLGDVGRLLDGDVGRLLDGDVGQLLGDVGRLLDGDVGRLLDGDVGRKLDLFEVRRGVVGKYGISGLRRRGLAVSPCPWIHTRCDETRSVRDLEPSLGEGLPLVETLLSSSRRLRDGRVVRRMLRSSSRRLRDGRVVRRSNRPSAKGGWGNGRDGGSDSVERSNAGRGGDWNGNGGSDSVERSNAGRGRDDWNGNGGSDSVERSNAGRGRDWNGNGGRGRTAHGRPPDPTVRGRLDEVSGDLALGRVLGDGGGGRVAARALDGRWLRYERDGRGAGAAVLCLWSYDLSR